MISSRLAILSRNWVIAMSTIIIAVFNHLINHFLHSTVFRTTVNSVAIPLFSANLNAVFLSIKSSRKLQLLTYAPFNMTAPFSIFSCELCNSFETQSIILFNILLSNTRRKTVSNISNFVLKLSASSFHFFIRS